MILNALIARTTLWLVKRRASVWRILLTAAAGTCFAVVFPFLSLGYALNIVAKLLLGLFLCFILIRKTPLRQFVAAYLIFLAVTFLFGGALYAILFFLGAGFYDALSFSYAYDFPVGPAAAAAWLLAVLLKRLVMPVHKTADAAAYLRSMEVSYGGRTVKLEAFVDTGNRIYDFVSGLPVVILSAAAAVRLLGEENLLKLVAGKLPGSRKIEFSSLAGQSGLTVFPPDRVVVYADKRANTIYDVMIGVSGARFCDAVGYEAILHPSLVAAWST